MRRAIVKAGMAALAAPLFGWGGAHAQSGKKFALIIANSDYDGDGKTDLTDAALERAQQRGYVGDLANPWFDGVRVGQALKQIGFAVTTFNNADIGMMGGAIAQHFSRVTGAGPNAASIIFYAGHGIQIGGQNYLVAARAQLIAAQMSAETAEDRTRIALRIGIPLHRLLPPQLQPAAPGYHLLLLDACRDNPWEELIRQRWSRPDRPYVGERGFGALSLASRRTVVCYSTSPGQVALDGLQSAGSPFAAALARGITQPGATVDGLVAGVYGEVASASGARQLPWSVGRLGDGSTVSG